MSIKKTRARSRVRFANHHDPYELAACWLYRIMVQVSSQGDLPLDAYHSRAKTVAGLLILSSLYRDDNEFCYSIVLLTEVLEHTDACGIKHPHSLKGFTDLEIKAQCPIVREEMLYYDVPYVSDCAVMEAKVSLLEILDMVESAEYVSDVLSFRSIVGDEEFNDRCIQGATKVCNLLLQYQDAQRR